MYEELLQSSNRPFRATPDVRFFYPFDSVDTARQTAERAVVRAEGPVLILGGAGLGKSLLAQVISDELDARFDVVRLHAARLCTRRALLQNILFELGMPYRDHSEGELRLSLLGRLEPSETSKPDGVLLVVDEAHTLPAKLLDELRIITNFTRAGEPRVRLVLIGNLRLEETLSHPHMDSFQQRIAARCYLQPMTRQQTTDYVLHQLSVAGTHPRDLITQDGLEAVYSACEGVPRLANQIMDHALMLAVANNQCPVSAALIEEAWADLQQLPAPWTSIADRNQPQSAAVPVEYGALNDSDEDSFEELPRPKAASMNQDVTKIWGDSVESNLPAQVQEDDATQPEPTNFFAAFSADDEPLQSPEQRNRPQSTHPRASRPIPETLGEPDRVAAAEPEQTNELEQTDEPEQTIYSGYDHGALATDWDPDNELQSESAISETEAVELTAESNQAVVANMEFGVEAETAIADCGSEDAVQTPQMDSSLVFEFHVCDDDARPLVTKEADAGPGETDPQPTIYGDSFPASFHVQVESGSEPQSFGTASLDSTHLTYQSTGSVPADTIEPSPVQQQRERPKIRIASEQPSIARQNAVSDVRANAVQSEDAQDQPQQSRLKEWAVYDRHNFFDSRPTDEDLIAFADEQAEIDSLGVWQNQPLPPEGRFTSANQASGNTDSQVFGSDFEEELQIGAQTPLSTNRWAVEHPAQAEVNTAFTEQTTTSNAHEPSAHGADQGTATGAADPLAWKSLEEVNNYVDQIEQFAKSVDSDTQFNLDGDANLQNQAGPAEINVSSEGFDTVSGETQVQDQYWCMQISTEDFNSPQPPTASDSLEAVPDEQAIVSLQSSGSLSLDTSQEQALQSELEDIVSQLNFSAFSVEPFSVEEISVGNPAQPQVVPVDSIRSGSGDQVYMLHTPCVSSSADLAADCEPFSAQAQTQPEATGTDDANNFGRGQTTTPQLALVKDPADVTDTQQQTPAEDRTIDFTSPVNGGESDFQTLPSDDWDDDRDLLIVEEELSSKKSSPPAMQSNPPAAPTANYNQLFSNLRK